MRGAVLNPFGGDLLDPFYGDPPAISGFPDSQDFVMPLQEFFGFWKWGVQTLQVSGSLTIDAFGASAVSASIPKGTDFIPSGTVALVGSEFEMVDGPGYWNYEQQIAVPSAPAGPSA